MANSYFNENTLEELIEEIKYVYKSDNRPWIIGYSGGKDSTTVVELVYKMLLGLKPDERHKNVYIVSSDTLIENPLIKIYLSKMNDLLGEAADRDGIPIKSAMVTPVPNNYFWANVIGRGFPTPRMNGVGNPLPTTFFTVSRTATITHVFGVFFITNFTNKHCFIPPYLILN